MIERKLKNRRKYYQGWGKKKKKKSKGRLRKEIKIRQVGRGC